MATVQERIKEINVQRDPEKFYDKWAEHYDDDLQNTLNYAGPRIMAELCNKYLGKHERILDLGAGTGLVGVILKDDGYDNIDALDGSQKMLDLAKPRGLYKKHIHAMIDPANPCKDIPNGTYDALYCQGCVSAGHMNPTHFPELYRMVKPLGLVFIGINGNFMKPTHEGERAFPYDIDGEMKRWEQEGVLKVIERREDKFFDGIVDGAYFVLKMLK